MNQNKALMIKARVMNIALNIALNETTTYIQPWLYVIILLEPYELRNILMSRGENVVYLSHTELLIVSNWK